MKICHHENKFLTTQLETWRNTEKLSAFMATISPTRSGKLKLNCAGRRTWLSPNGLLASTDGKSLASSCRWEQPPKQAG